MKLLNLIYLILIVFSLFSILIAQDPGDGFVFNEYQMQPEVSHFVTPDYGTVDAQGDLNIQIPIMNVPGRGLDFPIVFKYRSGIKVKQHASWIGLGWEFDPGSVTRDVKGSIIRLGDVMGVDFPNVFGNPAQDLYAHDIYYISINGSTTPVYKKYLESSLTSYLYPQNQFYPGTWVPWKIDSLGVSQITVDGITTTHADYTGFMVTKDDGTRYIFEEPTLAYYMNLDGSSSIPSVKINYVSTWRLRAILSTNYTSTNLIPTGSEAGSWIRFDYSYDSSDRIKTVEGSPFTNTASLAQLMYLDSIITPTHKAAFVTSVRTDPDGEVLVGSSPVILQKKLDSITLYSRNNVSTPIKTIELVHGAISFNKKLSLEEIKRYGRSINDPQKYSFDYWLENEDARTADDLRQWDHYGYYNKAYPNYSSDTTHAKAWSLKKVIYPTGGNETFYYENDEIRPDSMIYYHWIHPNALFTQQPYVIDYDNNRQGGIRVIKIERCDEMGNQYNFTYTYQMWGGKATAVPPLYFLRKDNAFGLNVGGARGHASVYYDGITKHNPDGSKVKTYYSNGDQCNVLCFSMNTNFQFSILQDNRDWNWGKVEKIEHYDKDFKLLNTQQMNYFNYDFILSNNSWDLSYPLNYFIGINYVTDESNTIHEAGIGTKSAGLEYKSLYSYLNFSWLKNKSEISSNGANQIRRMTEYEFAHKKYPGMMSNNMLNQIARTNIFEVDESQATYDTTISVSAEVNQYKMKFNIPGKIDEEQLNANENVIKTTYTVIDSAEFSVNEITTATYCCTLELGLNQNWSKFYIKQNGITIREHEGVNNNTITVNDSITLLPGNTYKIFAYASCSDIHSGSRARADADLTIELVSSGQFYSANVTTWKENNFTPTKINSSLWLPYKEYNWNDVRTWNVKPGFDAYSASSNPTDSRWKLIKKYTEYDEHGNLIKVEDAKGNQTELFYGDNTHNFNNDYNGLFHACLTGIRKNSFQLAYDYDPLSFQVTSMQDLNNKYKYYEYDDFDRLHKVKNNTSEKIADYKYYYSMNEHGGVFSSSDPNKIITSLYTSTSDSIVSVSYFDGLSRSIQVQQIDNGEAIVTASDYDPFDRISKVWKPYLYNDDQMDINYATNAKNYYNGTNGRPNAGDYPYTGTEYFDEPKNRMKSVHPPGNDFHYSNYLSNAYFLNKTSEISGYQENTLLKSINIDENKNATASFSDQLGNQIINRNLEFDQYVLVEEQFKFEAAAWEKNEYNSETKVISIADNQYISYIWEPYFYNLTGTVTVKILDPDDNIILDLSRNYTDTVIDSFPAVAGESYTFILTAELTPAKNNKNGSKLPGDLIRSVLTINYDINEPAFTTLTTTEFKHDIIGNLLKVTNPENQVTEYRYNTLGQMIAQTTPDLDGDGDGDPTDEVFTDINDCDIRYKYDKNGNLRFVQDANHRNGPGGHDIVFYQYDQFNRQTLIGEATVDISIPLWENLDPDVIYDGSEGENFENITIYPNNVKQQYYYDGDNAYSGANNLLGRISCIKYKTDNQWSYTYYSYSAEGWVEWIVQNIMGLEKKIEYEYDLQGNITKIVFDRNGANPFFQWMEYNELGQLDSVKCNNQNTIPDYAKAIYEYWPGGQVKTLKLGEKSGGSFAEVLNYQYTVRDWLDNINAPGSDFDPFHINTAFAMKLYYNNPPDSDPQYNGNISQIRYHSARPGAPLVGAQGLEHGYKFGYDNLYRLSSAQFEMYVPTTPNWVNGNNYTVSNINYDKVGNFEILSRKDDNGTATTYDYNYYSGSNLLQNADGSGDDFGYDANGSVISDVNKNVSNIVYDYRNLPTSIDFTSGENIKHSYNHEGNRIYKKFTLIGSVTPTGNYYIYDALGRTLAVYDLDGHLKFINLYGLDLIGKVY